MSCHMICVNSRFNTDCVGTACQVSQDPFFAVYTTLHLLIPYADYTYKMVTLCMRYSQQVAGSSFGLENNR